MRKRMLILHSEYMSLHIGSSFKGIVSGVNNQGIFVQLENSIEGFVPLQSLPDGIYESINGISLLNQLSGKNFTIGDKIVVRCVNTNVSMGEIEFDLPEYEDDINRNIKNTTAKQSTGKRPSRENKSDFAQSLEKSTRASRNNPYPKLKKVVLTANKTSAVVLQNNNYLFSSLKLSFKSTFC